MITVYEYLVAQLEFFGISANEIVVRGALEARGLTGDELLSEVDSCKYRVPLADLLHQSVLSVAPNRSRTETMGNYTLSESTSSSTAERIKSITDFANQIYKECGIEPVQSGGIYVLKWKNPNCGCRCR